MEPIRESYQTVMTLQHERDAAVARASAAEEDASNAWRGYRAIEKQLIAEREHIERLIRLKETSDELLARVKETIESSWCITCGAAKLQRDRNGEVQDGPCRCGDLAEVRLTRRYSRALKAVKTLLIGVETDVRLLGNHEVSERLDKALEEIRDVLGTSNSGGHS